MIVYAEVVFITNVFVDYFIFSLTSFILKSKVSVKRIVFLSFFGAFVSSLFPLFFSYDYAIKIVCVIVFPVFLRKNKSFCEYLVSLSCFSVVTFTIGGAFLFIKCCDRYGIYYNFSNGIIPILFSVSGMIALFLYRELSEYRKERNYIQRFTRSVLITNGRNEYKGEAFFDSGNHVFANNGEPVTFVNDKIYTMFDGEEEDLFISTIAGNVFVKAKIAEIMIYYEDGNNIIYTTKIARIPYESDNEIILNGLTEGET